MNFQYKYMITLMASFLFLLSSCIDEKCPEECKEQHVFVSFYSKTPCQSNVSYPQEIKDITLCVFDENEVLVSYTENKNVQLSENYYQEVQLDAGLYSIVAWSGLDDVHYDIDRLVVGATQKSDLLFRLKRVADEANSLEGENVYFGEDQNVSVLKNTCESAQKTFKINLQEITNRVTVLVEGLSDTDSYEVYLESDNGSMNLDGTIADDNLLKYTGVDIEEGIPGMRFTILKIEPTRTQTIVVTNRATGDEFFRGDLIEKLLLENPSINLNCDHDFTILFKIDDHTHAIVEIWVNGWLVHSYGTDV